MILLGCSPGGHLSQALLLLDQLREELGSHDVTLLTSRTPQGRGIPSDVRVELVREIPPRAAMRAAAAFAPMLARIRRADREDGLDAVVSTGAAIAVPLLTSARVLGHRAVFLESATRVTKPSLSGRAVSKVPGVECWGQWPGLADHGFALWRNVFDPYTPPPPPPAPPTQVLITTGTRYEFGLEGARRVALAVREAAPSLPITLQDSSLAVSEARELEAVGVEVRDQVPEQVLDVCVEDGGAIVTHAGIGSILRCLGMNHRPFVIARSARRNEHVDDHQLQIAAQLAGRGLVLDITDTAPEDAAKLILN